MVIDYILVGSVCQTSQCIQGLASTSAVRTVSAKKGVSACDPRSGGQFAVQEFGSDHLPVGQ